VGGAPSRVQGQSPYQGVTGAKPPEAENLSAFGCPTEAAKFASFPYFANSLKSKYL